jgi:hypothetical protein
LQILELLEAADKVDVEIEILELGQSLEFLWNDGQSIVWEIDPYELLPFVG